MLRTLRNEVESAWERYDRLAQRFHEVLNDPNSLPPYPDGVIYLRKLVRECRDAGDQLMQTLSERSGLRDGVSVATELKESPACTTPSCESFTPTC